MAHKIVLTRVQFVVGPLRQLGENPYAAQMMQADHAEDKFVRSVTGLAGVVACIRGDQCLMQQIEPVST